MEYFRRLLVKFIIRTSISYRINYPSLSCAVVYKDWYQSKMGKTKWTYYAVARGRHAGLYSTWNECKMQVDGYKGAKFKGFNSKDDAER